MKPTAGEVIYPSEIADQAAAAEIEARDVEQVLEAMGFEPHTVECYTCGEHHQVMTKPDQVALAGLEGEYYVEIPCSCSDDPARGFFVEEVTN